MAIYCYISPDGKTHLNTPSEYESLGYAHQNNTHYFYVPDGVEIPEQPESIGWREVTDADELAEMVSICCAFSGRVEEAKALFGIE